MSIVARLVLVLSIVAALCAGGVSGVSAHDAAARASAAERMAHAGHHMIPEGGVSMLDRPGAQFHDPAANAALFEAIEGTVTQTARRQIVRVNANINDPAFSEALVSAFTAIAGRARRTA